MSHLVFPSTVVMFGNSKARLSAELTLPPTPNTPKNISWFFQKMLVFHRPFLIEGRHHTLKKEGN